MILVGLRIAGAGSAFLADQRAVPRFSFNAGEPGNAASRSTPRACGGRRHCHPPRQPQAKLPPQG